MHWDERAIYLDGLAQVVQLKYPRWGAVPALSSPADTVSSSDPMPDRLSGMGFQTRTEGVPA